MNLLVVAYIIEPWYLILRQVWQSRPKLHDPVCFCGSNMSCLASISCHWCSSLCWNLRCSVCLSQHVRLSFDWVQLDCKFMKVFLLWRQVSMVKLTSYKQALHTVRRQDPHTTTWRMQAVRFCWDAPLSRHCCPKGTISSHLWLQMPRNNLTSARLTGLRPPLPLIERELLVAERVIRRDCILCWPAHIHLPVL